MPLAAEQVLDRVEREGFTAFRNGNWDLNIVGFRNESGEPNKFDDCCYVVYRDDSAIWRAHRYTITTDPGTYWLRNPGRVAGTAILKEGQYRGCWQLGLHRGQKSALVQIKPVTVYRDGDKDGQHDMNARQTETGLFGINLHRAGTNSTNVDKWSAGCQVWANDAEFEHFLSLCRQQVSKRAWKTFSYTLLVGERA